MKPRSIFRYGAPKHYKDRKYVCMNLPEASPSSFNLAASTEFVATPHTASGNVVVFPTDHTKYKRTDTPPVLSVGSNVLDLAWSSFNDRLLATGGADGLVKLWSVPEAGLTESVSNADSKLAADGAVNYIRWHPTASNVLATASRTAITVFDVEKGSARYTFGSGENSKEVLSVGWNYDGSLLAACGKDNHIYVVDPRTGEDVLNKGADMKGADYRKLHHTLFVGDAGKGTLVLLGQDKMHKPAISFWDPRNLAGGPISRPSLAMSSGFTLPLYDHDTQLLFLSVRGSGSINFFDLAEEKKGPGFFQTQSFACDDAFRGACLLPKRGVDALAAEVSRIFVSGVDSIQQYGVIVPRKTLGFHAELFPNTASGVPSLTADEWFAGDNKDPLTVSFEKVLESRPDSKSHRASPAPSTTPTPTEDPIGRSGSPGIARSTSPSVGSGSPTSSGIFSARQPEEKKEDKKSAQYVQSEARKQLESKLKSSKWQHITANEPDLLAKQRTYFDLRLAPSLALNRNIRANRLFFAVPWTASGGSAVAVFGLEKLGRAPEHVPCVRGHKTQVTAFDLSPFDHHLLATGSAEGQVKLWRIPEGGLTGDLTEAATTLETEGKVTHVIFHPYVTDVLVTSSVTPQGPDVAFWDLKTNNREIRMAGHNEPLVDITFDSRTARIATTSKDGRARVFNARSQSLIAEFETPESKRDPQIIWAGRDRVITVGFGAASRRSVSLWNVNDTKSPIKTVDVGHSNALPIPAYDEDSGLLFIAHNGAPSMNIFQVTEEAPYVEALPTWQSNSDFTGQVFFHKLVCDVRKVEVARSLKLSRNKVCPVSWTLPRKRLEFFQDDLYGAGARTDQPIWTSSEWFTSTEDREPSIVDMRPADMTPLSQAPPEEKTERQLKYEQQLATSVAPKSKGILGHTSAAEVKQHFSEVAKTMPTKNRWDARQDEKDEVDDGEWD